MFGLELLPLERALVGIIAAENWPGFQVHGLRVIRREDTGAGRYTYFHDELDQRVVDGTYAAQGRMLGMDGSQNALAFVVDVSNSRIHYLEIATYGTEAWGGREGDWRVV
jgi:hypothetical protein